MWQAGSEAKIEDKADTDQEQDNQRDDEGPGRQAVGRRESLTRTAQKNEIDRKKKGEDKKNNQYVGCSARLVHLGFEIGHNLAVMRLMLGHKCVVIFLFKPAKLFLMIEEHLTMLSLKCFFCITFVDNPQNDIHILLFFLRDRGQRNAGIQFRNGQVVMRRKKLQITSGGFGFAGIPF